MANSSGECPVPDQSHLPARPTRFPPAFRDTPASVAGANRTRIPRDDRVAAPGDPPATRAPTHPPPVALKFFSRISHLGLSSDLPAQSHRFFLRSIGMRQDLVDWMSQQHSTLELVDETLHLAIRYLDTFLNRRGAHRPRPPRANRPTPSSKYPLKPENQCA